MKVPWSVEAPNHGYLLRAGGSVVGAQLAYYSRRRDPRPGRLDICNLGAWSVDAEYRFSGMRLLKAVLAQDGYHFTDLSPSGNVVPLNERLHFTHLDTTTALSLNTSPLPSRAEVSSDPDVVEAHLSDEGPSGLPGPSRDRRGSARRPGRRDSAAATSCSATTGAGACRSSSASSTSATRSCFTGTSAPSHGSRCCGTAPWRRCPSFASSDANRRCRGWCPALAPRCSAAVCSTAGDVDYLYSELECLEW